MAVVNPGIPDKIIDAPYTGTVVQYGTYSRTNDTGANKLVGYGRIPGLDASPTGNASTQPLPASSANTTDVVAQAAALVGGFGLALGFLFVGALVIGAGFMFFSAFG
jgi:hypothetical protein